MNEPFQIISSKVGGIDTKLKNGTSGFLRKALFMVLIAGIFTSTLFVSSADAQSIGLGFGRLISPGDLAEQHKPWDSILKCIDCHDLRGGVNEEKCLDCHKDIKLRIQEKKGYHAHRKVTSKDCKKCHADHKGRKFKMIAWPDGKQSKFNHNQANYPLEDKHKTAKCEACHNKKTESGAVTYLGLETTCISCHKDIHEKTLKQTCENCHVNARSFKGQDVKFDHTKQTKYRLDGKHNKVACSKCHTGATKQRAIFRVAKFESCITCHKAQDVHKGALSDKCEDCHLTSDWKKVPKFDHSKTRYALRYKHMKVDCASCHPDAKKGLYKVEKYDTCSAGGCHDISERGQIHGIQFAGRKCDDCHSERGWKPVIFSHENRTYTGFKLKGKHAKVKCEDCHSATSETAKYKRNMWVVLYRPIDTSSCSTKGCHDVKKRGSQAHGAQFVGRKCDECHNETGWKPSVFKHSNPSYTGYKLSGKHKDVACEKCHIKKRNGEVVYKPIVSTTCNGSGCHDSPQRGDIHNGQFKGKDCAECHTVDGFKPTTFKHETAEYKLEGKHSKVKCEKCHQATTKTVAYKGKSFPVNRYKPFNTTLCSNSGCHNVDPHKGVFRPKKCDECHVVTGWTDLSNKFDHTLDTKFPLIGKHYTTKCDKCHLIEGKKVWKPVSIGCNDCHAKEDKHKGALGKGCDECHHTASWDPKSIAHEVTGFPLTQTHAQLVCSDCHTKGAGEYTGLSPDCQQCHTSPHQNQFGRLCGDCHNMTNWEPLKFKHSQTGFRLEGGHRFADCQQCHKHRIYRTLPNDCFNCHQEDFYRNALFHSPSNTNCLDCHNLYVFAPAKRYTHTTMTFTGAHSAIRGDCATCHPSGGGTLKWPGATYEADCYLCHQENYSSRHVTCPQTCSLCHNTTSFQGASLAVPCQ